MKFIKGALASLMNLIQGFLYLSEVGDLLNLGKKAFEPTKLGRLSRLYVA